jgi:cytochrome c peroxidase
LGDPDHAAGDPTDIVVTSDNRQVVCFAGVDQVGISDPGANYYRPTLVGRRPTVLQLGPEERVIYAANTLSDSVSVIEMGSGRKVQDISLGPTPSSQAEHLGERLFYDARLSSDGWYSCHSCHTDGHSNGGLNDNFSDDSYGAPKRVLSLLGIAGTAPYSWLGKTETLEEQIRNSIAFTMRGPKPTEHQVHALAAFLKTLEPPPPLLQARRTEVNASIRRGRRVFQRIGCADCHPPQTYTSSDRYDVGVHDELGHQEFNPPSLRGVSQRGKLLHDNRARGLEEVLTRERHNLPEDIERPDLRDLLQFLRSI